MSRLDTLIDHMQQSADGNRTMGDAELRLISSGAGKIANSMVGDHKMEWVEANRIWDHVINVAKQRGIRMDMPSIPDLSQLTADNLNAGMAEKSVGAWTEKEVARTGASTGPERWV